MNTDGFTPYGDMLVPTDYAEREWAQLSEGQRAFDELAELTEARALHEAAREMRDSVAPDVRQMIEASGDWRMEFDSPYNRGAEHERLGILGSYNLLREWTIYERMAILERCHSVWERNPVANTAVGMTTLFVVGKGLQITALNEDVKAVIDAFVDDEENDIEAAQTNLVDALQIDGEVFVRYFTAGGVTKIATLRPWDIKWLVVDPQFRKRVQYYKQIATFWDGFTANVAVNEDIPSGDVRHVKINDLPYELRGRPDLFRILPWLKAYKDWLEERVRLMRRKSIYYHMQLKNATPSQVAAARSQYREPPPPGSFLVTNDNVSMTELSSRIAAGDAVEDGRAIKLMAIAGKKLPEYMLGEGAHATRATASTQELPALLSFQYFQSVMVRRFWKPTLRRMLENAIDAGLLPQTVVKQDTLGNAVQRNGADQIINTLDAFDVQYPDVVENDPLTLAQAMQIADASGWASKGTISVRMGFDWDAEQEKLEQEQSKSMANAYAATGPVQMAAPQTGPVQLAPEGDETDESVREADGASQITVNVPPTVVNITNQMPAQEPPTVNVEAPYVTVENNVPPAQVTVKESPAPQVTVNQPAPVVNVAAPIVNVKAPEAKPVTKRILRDRDGRMIGIEEEPQ